MIDERLVVLPGLVGPLTSRQASALAAPLVDGAAPWRIGTEDGCDADGRSIRWELRYDDGSAECEVHVAMASGDGSGVASIARVPFPAPGSELARMVSKGEISARRLRAVWRQQMRERPPLDPGFPDSAAMARLVPSEPIRAAYARVTRQRGPVWVVRTPGRTRHLRMDDFR